MAQPVKAQTHIDGPLSNFSIAFTQDEKNFIAGKVFPDVGVSKQSDKYFVYDRTTFMRDQFKERGAGEESAGTGYTLSNDTFYCKVYALHKDISDIDRANFDAPLDADRDATLLLTQAALLRKEKEFVDTFFTTGVWGTDNTTATDWNDYVNSDPIGDNDTAKLTVLTATGRDPNTLVMGLSVFNQLKNHPDVVDRIKYTSSRVVTEDVLATLLGYDRVFVPRAVLDSVAEGKTAAPALIHGKHALACYVHPNAGINTPTAGLTFNWTGLGAGYTGQGLAMKKMRMEPLNGDRVEGQMAFDQKCTSSALGFFWSGVVA